MRIARVQTADGPRPAVARGEEWLFVEDPYAPVPTPSGGSVPAADAVLLAPCRPRVIVAMAHNQWQADGERLPTQAFLKSARTVTGPGGAILVDPELGTTNVEVELTAVIGREARNLTRADALSALRGFTIGNDVTGLTQIAEDSLLTQGKNGDGFTAIGPWIETELADPDDREMRVVVDGKLVASGATSQLVDGVIDQLVYLTRYLTLGPGDVVLGGCPGAWAPVADGNTVRLEIDGIGALENRVARS